MKSKPKISDAEIVEIAYRVLVEKENQTAVAKAFRVSPSRISFLANKVERHPLFIAELQAKRERRNDRSSLIRVKVLQMLA